MAAAGVLDAGERERREAAARGGAVGPEPGAGARPGRAPQGRRRLVRIGRLLAAPYAAPTQMEALF